MVKRCTKCGVEKSLDDFHRDRSRTDGRQTFCKECVRDVGRRRRKAHPNYLRAYHVKRKYGITLEEYDALLAAGCAICGGAGTHLDHDHATGAIRKALCEACNWMLGHARDNPAVLRAGADYLEEHA